MYNLSFIEEIEKNAFLNIINNRGLIPKIIDDKLFVFNMNHECFCVKNVSDLCINDINDIFNISIVESKYIYYLIDIAYNNEKGYCKKKSL